MKLLVREISYYQLPLATRFPFQYGIASMTDAPQIFLRAVCEFDGAEAIGRERRLAAAKVVYQESANNV